MKNFSTVASRLREEREVDGCKNSLHSGIEEIKFHHVYLIQG